MVNYTQVGWFLFYAGGIIGMLVLYGVLQERIMTVDYDGERFTSSVYLVFMNRLFAVAFSLCMIFVYREEMGNKAPLWKYLIVSLSNVYASTCQYEALKYVTFAVQMLGKSFKMMPVMIWGIIISGKRYGCTDWTVAALVTGGVTAFLMTGPVSDDDGGRSSSAFKGFLLLGAFLALDGLTSTMQEKLFREHSTSKYNQMLYINLLSACVSLVTMAVSGELVDGIGFSHRHALFVLDASVLSVAAVGGQFFIYSQIRMFGALVFAATMNVRQVASIIVSYITYGHTITGWQVASLAIVFGALFWKSYLAFASEKDAAETEPLLPQKTRGPDEEEAQAPNGHHRGEPPIEIDKRV